MSVQALAWALEKAEIPNVTPTGMPAAPALALVLVGLANHAGADGRNAYPSISRLAKYARLSDRQTKRALSALVELGLITVGNQAVAAADIDRADRRPTVYNLNVNGVTAQSPRDLNGVTGETERGDRRDPNGVSAPSPKPRTKPRDKPFPGSDEPTPIDVGLDPELSWLPTDAHLESAHRRGLHLQDEAEKFRLHAKANDRRQADWDSAFGNWLINSEKFANRSPAQQGGRQTNRDRTSGILVER